MLNILLRISLVFISVLSLAGCGWHPRGSQDIGLQTRQLRLVTEQPNAALTLKLRRALLVAGVELVDDAGSTLSLHLGTEQRESRKVSLDRDARSAEQEMRVAVAFDLRNADGEVVFGPRTASASRIYAFDPNSIIAKQDEENLIYQELLDNVTGQVLRQMRRAEAGLAP
jgi:LPS-assembly lipoprotein